MILIWTTRPYRENQGYRKWSANICSLRAKLSLCRIFLNKTHRYPNILLYITMRHTIEEKRKMRNARKKRKRLQKTDLKRATLIKNALCDIRAEANQQRDVASKYYKLWKSTVDKNKKLRTIVNQRESNKKVYQSFSNHIQHYLY